MPDHVDPSPTHTCTQLPLMSCAACMEQTRAALAIDAELAGWDTWPRFLAAELSAVAKVAIGMVAALSCLLPAVFGVVSVCELLADFMWAVWP